MKMKFFHSVKSNINRFRCARSLLSYFVNCFIQTFFEYDTSLPRSKRSKDVAYFYKSLLTLLLPNQEPVRGKSASRNRGNSKSQG